MNRETQNSSNSFLSTRNFVKNSLNIFIFEYFSELYEDLIHVSRVLKRDGLGGDSISSHTNIQRNYTYTTPEYILILNFNLINLNIFFVSHTLIYNSK